MLRLGASRDNGNAFLYQKPKKYLDRSFAIFFSKSKNRRLLKHLLSMVIIWGNTD